MIQDDEKKSIDLSLESGVMSKFTSYIAVSTNSFSNLKEENDEETMVDDLDEISIVMKEAIEMYHSMDKTMMQAMLKSYSESNGTILSENWSDVHNENEQHASINIEKEKESVNSNDGSIENETISHIQEKGFFRFSESPIVKKRILSSIFTLAYLSKFMGDVTVKWRFTKDKAIK